MPRRRSKKTRAPNASRPSSARLGFLISLTPRDGAPDRPTEKDLQGAFTRAWLLVPPHRRPDVPAAYLKRMAVDVLVVSDKEIAALNAAHLKHKGPTDVLSFPMGELDPERQAYSLGEIVVSFETAKREAIERRLEPDEELTRYCVHGFLHLLGYEDETKQQRDAMFAVQEGALGKRNASPRKQRDSRSHQEN
jgi:probable rRNA maturation factor